jgi:hypothetical protein
MLRGLTRRSSAGSRALNRWKACSVTVCRRKRLTRWNFVGGCNGSGQPSRYKQSNERPGANPKRPPYRRAPSSEKVPIRTRHRISRTEQNLFGRFDLHDDQSVGNDVHPEPCVDPAIAVKPRQRERGIDGLAGKTIALRRGFRHLGALASWRLGAEPEQYPHHRALTGQPGNFAQILTFPGASSDSETPRRQGAKSASVDPPRGAILDQHNGIAHPGVGSKPRSRKTCCPVSLRSKSTNRRTAGRPARAAGTTKS